MVVCCFGVLFAALLRFDCCCLFCCLCWFCMRLVDFGIVLNTYVVCGWARELGLLRGLWFGVYATYWLLVFFRLVCVGVLYLVGSCSGYFVCVLLVCLV